MFGLLKYFYSSPKLEITDTLIDDEPEIIDSYNDVLEFIEIKNEEIKLKKEEMELEIKIEEIEINTGSITENILKKLNKSSLSSRNKKNLMYLVLSKNTREPLGIYDSLDKAKQYGQKATYYNCSILRFNVNDSCRYLIDPIFEDK